MGLRSARGRALIGLGLALCGVGVVTWLSAAPTQPPTVGEIDARQNPYPPTPDALARGERVYQAQCQACHGLTGHGNGPLAATLYPRPIDFWAHFGSGHTHPDGRLYFWVTYGMPGTAMPGFKDRLNDADRWRVVDYIKTFAPVVQ
jgi:copper transport protein